MEPDTVYKAFLLYIKKEGRNGKTLATPSMGECRVRAWNGTKNQELMGDELTGASLNFRSALLLTLDQVLDACLAAYTASSTSYFPADATSVMTYSVAGSIV